MGLFKKLFQWRVEKGYAARFFPEEWRPYLLDSDNITEGEAFKCIFIPGQEAKIVEQMYLRGKVKEMKNDGTFSERTLNEFNTLLKDTIKKSPKKK